MKPPEKVKVPITKFNRLINHGPIILVTTHDGKRPNVMTVAWNMPCSRRPPTVALAIGSASRTSEILRDTGELVINIPPSELLEEAVLCGRHSGKDTDKFADFNITPQPGTGTKAPWIAECIGHLECSLVRGFEKAADEYNLYLVEVKSAWAESRAFCNDRWLVEKGVRTLHHLGGPYFTIPEKLLKQE